MKDLLQTLFDRISGLNEVRGIGVSGEMKFPKAGEGDVDVFIYCGAVPPLGARLDAMHSIGDSAKIKAGVIEDCFWGTGDLAVIDGVEVWLMYFTEKETEEFIDSILRGDHPDKLGNYFYPTGRCAMLKNINIIYDGDGFLGSLKQKLLTYPEPLAKRLAAYHMEALQDTEDLLRAVARKDVLFYHFAMDIALDHFLQALFALNRTFFPSRKRSFQYIAVFSEKPEKCEERLRNVLGAGGIPEGLGDSYAMWDRLAGDLKKIADGHSA
jgi:hypothetical protein